MAVVEEEEKGRGGGGAAARCCETRHLAHMKGDAGEAERDAVVIELRGVG